MELDLDLDLPLQLMVVGYESQEPTRLLRDFGGCATRFKIFIYTYVLYFLAKKTGPTSLRA